MKIDDYIRAVMGLTVIGVFCYLAVSSEGYKEALIASAAGVLGYYIGSSSGSKVKDKQPENMNDRPT
jgi:hypothetical protein